MSPQLASQVGTPEYSSSWVQSSVLVSTAAQPPSSSMDTSNMVWWSVHRRGPRVSYTSDLGMDPEDTRKGDKPDTRARFQVCMKWSCK